MNGSSRTRVLQRARWVLASAIAWFITLFPASEAAVIRLLRSASRRSRLLSGLYWFTQESLIDRLRHGGERYRAVTVFNTPLRLDITDATGRLPFFYKSVYEPGVTDTIVTALKPDDVFVDIGANIGYFSVLAAQLVGPRGKVIAFEPHPAARDALDETVQRNGAAPIVDVVSLALCETEGDVTLFTEERITASSTIEPSLSPMRHVAVLRPAANVRATTLDRWLASRVNLMRRVRCIKIDVQGAEARVLAGMAKTLAIPNLTIVCHTALGGKADATLAAAGFQRQRIEPGTSAYGNFLYLRP